MVFTARMASNNHDFSKRKGCMHHDALRWMHALQTEEVLANPTEDQKSRTGRIRTLPSLFTCSSQRNWPESGRHHDVTQCLPLSRRLPPGPSVSPTTGPRHRRVRLGGDVRRLGHRSIGSLTELLLVQLVVVLCGQRSQARKGDGGVVRVQSGGVFLGLKVGKNAHRKENTKTAETS